MKKVASFISSIFVFINFGNSQDFSNKGRDFWIGYGNHVRMFDPRLIPPATTCYTSGNSQNCPEKMQVYITSDVNTTGSVEIPAIGFSQPFTVTANQITTIDIPRSAALPDEGLYSTGIHVTAAAPIVVYSFIYVSAISGASLCLPTNVLGKDYYSVNYDQLSNENNSYSYFFVVATEDNTTVEITPSKATKGGRAANSTFTVNLSKGQIYQVLATADLTGSVIKSVSSGPGGCKRIGVFCGSGKISIGCTNAASSSDNLYQQIYPTSTWGKKFLTTPSTNNTAGSNNQVNFFRIISPNASATVKLNGTVIPRARFTNGFYYQFSSNSPNVIEADKPILVVQYFTTSGNGPNCGNTGPGDPEMIYLNPVEQTISSVTLNSMQPSTGTNINIHFINVVVKNTGNAINSFRIDGNTYISRFSTFPQDSNFAYARIPVSRGTHNLTCDSGFNAIAYGFGSAESYGYSAGTNIRDLYQYVTLENQYTTTNFPATCKNTPFSYSITLPYQPTSLNWDFNNNPNQSPNNNIINTSPRPDSSFVRDGKTLYVYRLTAIYNFNATGTYPVKVIANNPTSDGCSGIQEISYDVIVYDPPVVDFSTTSNGCVSYPVQFYDSTDARPRTTVRWMWNFGDNTTDSVKNPAKKYNKAGTYNIKLRAITDVGCIADTTKPFVISPQPVANFGFGGSACVNRAITFSDSSSVATGTIVKWYWNFGNGDSVVATSNSNQTKIYATTGNFLVTLQVETSTGCKSVVFTRMVNVHANPKVDFTLPSVCLPYGTSHFNNLTNFEEPVPTDSATFYKWYFGDSDSSSLKNPVHLYSSAGPFSVKLSVTSWYGCTHDTTKQLTTIYTQPKAAFNTTGEVCLRDTSMFTDKSNGNGSSIVAWKWNFGDNSTDSIQNPNHRYAKPGTYKASLYTITDKGCVSDTFDFGIVVNPLPAADFTISSPACAAKDITITDKSQVTTGALTSWFWNFGDGTNAAYNNSDAFVKKYDSAGKYTITVAVKSDKGCNSDPAAQQISINPLPAANFITPQVCLSDALAQFKDSSYIAGGTINTATFAWNFGDKNSTSANPNTSTLRNPTHKYSATGYYDVTLTVRSSSGCVATATKQFTVNGSVPKSNFSILNSGSLCSNTAVQIQNTSSVDFGSVTRVEIIWDVINEPQTVVADSFPTTNEIYAHNYRALQVTKTYQVKLRAFSGISCVDETVKTITVNGSPKMSFATIPGICFDANARQITQANGGDVAGAGVFSGTGVSASGLFNPAVAGAGTFAIRYLYTTDRGCKDSIDRPITVWPSPTAKWSYSSLTCTNNLITFTDSSSANYSNISQWNWNFGNGTSVTYANRNPFVQTYAAAGVYPVSLQVKTDSGCVSTATMQTINVHPLPKVDFILPNVCLPAGQATFNNLSTIADGSDGALTYVWKYGDPNNPATSVAKSGAHQYSSTGPFAVQLIVTSGNGCVDSLTKSLTTVFPQPKASFTVSPTDSCLGGTFYFTDKSDGLTSNIASWSWDFNDGTKSNVQNPSKKFAAAGTFNVSLSIVNQQGCVSDTAAKNIVVHPYPTVNAGADLSVLEGGTTVLDPNVRGTNLQYKWTPDTYLDNSTVARPTSTPADDITYRLTVTATGGCTAYDEVFIKVLKAPTIPNAFSPNGDGINDVWNIKYLESYPGCTVQVFNRYGVAIFSSNGYPKPWDGTMNGSAVPVGVYYYIINPKNGRKAYTGSLTILR